MKRKSVLLFLTGYLAYSAVYVCRLNLSAAAPVLQTLGGMTKAQVGWLSSAFFVTYSAGQLLNGYLGDRLKARSMICIGLLLTGLCNLVIGVLPVYMAILFFWAVNGYAQSMVWGPLLRTISGSFGPEKGRYAASALISSVAAGSVAGILLASYCAAALGICFAFILPGLLALICAVICFLLFPVRAPAEKEKRSSPLRLFQKPGIFMILLPAMLHGVLKDNINLWAPLYFAEAFHTTVADTAFYVLAIPLISLVGRMLYPILYKACRCREHLVSQLALAASGLALLPLCADAAPAVAAVCLGIVAAAVSIVNTSFLSIYPMGFKREGSVSSVAGIVDFSTYLGAGISSAVYGYVLEASGFKSMYVSWILLCIAAIVILRSYERKYSYEKISDSEGRDVL